MTENKNTIQNNYPPVSRLSKVSYFWTSRDVLDKGDATPVEAKMVESVVDYKYPSSKHHAGIKANELITDYDIGVRQD